jgi:hypothetical protein
MQRLSKAQPGHAWHSKGMAQPRAAKAGQGKARAGRGAATHGTAKQGQSNNVKVNK